MAAVIAALTFVLCTQHAWEDYYITFRMSRNLASGQGLVFNVGERLHTFTSPLGVLLPALCSLLTLNSSDDAALWAFRLMSIAAFAGAAAMMTALLSQLNYHRVATLMVGIWMITDAKSLDFSINGMETGLLLLFLSCSIHALFSAGPRRWLWLGLAWGGLMWTRPDGVIYIAGMMLGTLAFGGRECSGQTRSMWLKTFALAGLVAAAVYLPWFVGSWIYYGSPIPHTIIAKAAVAGPKTLMGAVAAFVKLPLTGWTGVEPMDGTFLPSYFIFGGWPPFLVLTGRAIAWASAWLWLLPWVRWESRVASLTYAILMAYLSYCPNYPYPWYLPGPAWLAVLALGGALTALLDAFAHSVKGKLARVIMAATACLMALNWWLTLEASKQIAVQQAVIDGGNRRFVGEWLKGHAAPGDRVFLESLGYIGFYSGLKTLDIPGLSSPEVVKVVKQTGLHWDKIIAELKPEWLVLRPSEVMTRFGEDRTTLTGHYKIAEVFDVGEQAGAFDLHGGALLAFDSIFVVFHKTD